MRRRPLDAKLLDASGRRRRGNSLRPNLSRNFGPQARGGVRYGKVPIHETACPAFPDIVEATGHEQLPFTARVHTCPTITPPRVPEDKSPFVPSQAGPQFLVCQQQIHHEELESREIQSRRSTQGTTKPTLSRSPPRFDHSSTKACLRDHHSSSRSPNSTALRQRGPSAEAYLRNSHFRARNPSDFHRDTRYAASRQPLRRRPRCHPEVRGQRLAKFSSSANRGGTLFPRRSP